MDWWGGTGILLPESGEREDSLQHAMRIAEKSKLPVLILHLSPCSWPL
jgi:hypothetical protein